LNGTCFNKVHNNFYLSEEKTSQGSFYKLKKCSDNCKVCSDLEKCIYCEDDFELFEGQCKKHCASNYYPIGGECLKCIEPCKSCFNATHCKSCLDDNKHLFNGQCVESCPVGYFSDNANKCSACYPSCSECKGPSSGNCLSCSIGFNFNQIDNTCKSICPDATFYNTNTNSCQICDASSCHFCIKSPTTCTKCLQPKVLDLSTMKCKICCSRSIHGTAAESCCSCPEVWTGFCDSSNSSLSSSHSIDKIKIKNQSRIISASYFVLMIVSLMLLIISIKYFLKYKKRENESKNLERNNNYFLLDTEDDDDDDDDDNDKNQSTSL
jgi:hypothetical protein